MPGSGRPRAFILLGGFGVMVRNWIYLTELERRGLHILVITSQDWRSATEQSMTSGEWPGTLIAGAGFVAGDVSVEGTFTADVIAQVMAWRSRYDIVGVFAVGEMLVEQTGILADMLGLPSPGLRATRVCRSKYLQRAYLSDWSPGVTVIPGSHRVDPDLGGVRYPAVLKPASRRSSSGVRAVTDSRQLLSCLDEYLPTETLLVEDYVTGQEFSVETLVQRGRVVFESLTQKRTNEGTNQRFVELSHTVPAPSVPGEKALLAASRAILSQLNFEDGIAHTELRLTADNKVVLMEIAARTPGDGLLPLYHLSTGRPMEPDIIRITLGEAVDYPAPVRVSRQVYLETPPGTLRDVCVTYGNFTETVWVADGEPWPELRPGAPDDPPALRAVVVLKKRGDKISKLTESDDRVVTFLIDARSMGELDELEASVRSSIAVHIEQ